MSSIPPLPFTADDAERALIEWGANCGPGAVAAIAGVSLDELRPHLGDFERKRYTNPRLMWLVLRSIGLSFKLVQPPIELPRFGLARVQWHGPWMEPGVPPAAAYRHTHWIGACWSEVRRAWGVFDINCMESGGWVGFMDWQQVIVPFLTQHHHPECNGRWSFTHVVEVEPKVPG